MNKKILSAMFFVVFSALCFADTIWHFESGSSELGYKKFSSVLVRNKTGSVIEVEDEFLSNNSKSTYYTDSIIISSNAYDSDSLEAVPKINNRRLEVTLGRKGNYGQVTENVYIIPTQTLAPPPPPLVKEAPREERYKDSPTPSKKKAKPEKKKRPETDDAASPKNESHTLERPPKPKK